MIGRCADYILAGRPDVVRVFVHADKDFCVEQAMKVDSLPGKTRSEKKISGDRRLPCALLQAPRATTGMMRETYDLSLNSGVLGFEGVVEDRQIYGSPQRVLQVNSEKGAPEQGAP